MSAIITNADKAFCKFCFDSGKPDYNTHWLRMTADKTSIVCCPELNKIKCRYCKVAGHTISYCKVLKDKERRVSLAGIAKRGKPVILSDGFTMIVSANGSRSAAKKMTPKEPSMASLGGMFAALDCDDNTMSDDSECEECVASESQEKMEITPPEELVVTSPYLEAVKYGIRAAPQLENEFRGDPDTHTPNGFMGKIEFGKKSETKWADECECE